MQCNWLINIYVVIKVWIKIKMKKQKNAFIENGILFGNFFLMITNIKIFF